MKRTPSLILILPILLTIICSFFLQVTVLSNMERVRVWLSSFGSWFVLVYILVQTTTIIIAPIGGAFIWLSMVAVMGPEKGLILSYLVTTPAYCVNFFLAKRYGREIVKRLTGEKALEKIDHFASDAGVAALSIFKVFQGGYFDYVSYGAGLTKISWRDFLLVNFLGGIPGAFITFYVFSLFDNFLAGVLAFYALTGFLIGLSVYLHHILRKHKTRCTS